jgi:hypothetical protein
MEHSITMKLTDPKHNRLSLSPSRRDLLRAWSNGFGTLALASLLTDEAQAQGSGNRTSQHPTPNFQHLIPKAKRIIYIYLCGGPSHLDTFDPKPRLNREHGQPLPFAKPTLERTRTGNIFGSPFQFKKHGRSGIEVSELLPHLAGCVDDLCIIRSMVADNINHNGAALQMNTGEQAFSRPSLGSWLQYGLGTENRNLPGYVVLSPQQPLQGAPLWSASFLPAEFQGTLVSDLKNPIANLRRADGNADAQIRQLEALRRLNALHREGREDDLRLNGRMESFELAFRMQREAPEAFDIDRESPETKKLYGLDNPITETFGRQCLMARRLSERGVRMVQIFHTQTASRTSCQLWDQHAELQKYIRENCASTDKPIAGLLQDLKARGLMKDTLVIWGGEFGRSPTAEGTDGREHHPFGFTVWLAGGGVKSGYVHGATDEYGWHATENRVHVHDLHATILHLMGMDHTKLTYRYGGRDYRLTDVYGNVVKGILA